MLGTVSAAAMQSALPKMGRTLHIAEGTGIGAGGHCARSWSGLGARINVADPGVSGALDLISGETGDLGRRRRARTESRADLRQAVAGGTTARAGSQGRSRGRRCCRLGRAQQTLTNRRRRSNIFVPLDRPIVIIPFERRAANGGQRRTPCACTAAVHQPRRIWTPPPCPAAVGSWRSIAAPQITLFSGEVRSASRRPCSTCRRPAALGRDWLGTMPEMGYRSSAAGTGVILRRPGSNVGREHYGRCLFRSDRQRLAPDLARRQDAVLATTTRMTASWNTDLPVQPNPPESFRRYQTNRDRHGVSLTQLLCRQRNQLLRKVVSSSSACWRSLTIVANGSMVLLTHPSSPAPATTQVCQDRRLYASVRAVPHRNVRNRRGDGDESRQHRSARDRFQSNCSHVAGKYRAGIARRHHSREIGIFGLAVRPLRRAWKPSTTCSWRCCRRYGNEGRTVEPERSSCCRAVRRNRQRTTAHIATGRSMLDCGGTPDVPSGIFSSTADRRDLRSRS